MNMTYKKTSDKLPILFSCRVRLTDDQRQTLKQAYHQQLSELAPQPPRIGGSTVTTTTAAIHPITREIPSIVLSDLLTTRESLPLDTLIRLQAAFGVEVLKPSDIIQAAKDYTEYMFRSRDAAPEAP